MGTDRTPPECDAKTGDVLITREAVSPVRFTVRQVPGAVQLSAATCAEAMRIARAYARTHRLDVWYGENGTVRLVEAYRRKLKPAAHVLRLPMA